MFAVVIVSPSGVEFDPEEAPTFATVEEARDAGLQCAFVLDTLGDSRSTVIVRNLLTGAVESEYVAELGQARALAGR